MSNVITPTSIVRLIPCQITNGEDWIRVETPKGYRIFSAGDTPGGWEMFNQPEETALFDKLMGVNGQINLSIPELQLFKSIVDRAEAAANDNDAIKSNGVSPSTMTMNGVKAECEVVGMEFKSEVKDLIQLLNNLQSKSNDKRPLYAIKYYIPSKVSLPTKKGGHGMFANLAERMRAHKMVSFDGSCYYGHLKNKPTSVFEEMDHWNTLDFVKATEGLPRRYTLKVEYTWEQIHPDEMQTKRDAAFRSLKEHVVELHLSLIDKIDSAANKIAELEKKAEKGEEVTEKEQSLVEKQRIDNLSNAISVAKKELGHAISMAEAFDETESLEPLFQGLKHAIQSNHATLVALRQTAREKKGK